MHRSWWTYLRYDEEKDQPHIDWTLLRRVWQYAKPYRLKVVGLLLTILAITGLSLVPPKSVLWLDPEAVQHSELDRKDLYRTNYEAMKLAVKRAMDNSPSIDELIANRNKLHHEMYNPETGESIW